KMQLAHSAGGAPGRPGRPAFALVTFIPLLWLMSVTMTAGVQKIFHADTRIGFLAQAEFLERKLPELQQAVAAAGSSGTAGAFESAEKALRANRVLRFNQMLD